MSDHKWRDAPPGQGRDMICMSCGLRKSVVEAPLRVNEPPLSCRGTSPDNVVYMQKDMDYDPFE